MQLGFFDLERKYVILDKLGDPLGVLNQLINFEMFRPNLESVFRNDVTVGRPPWDRVMMFKILILKRLYALSDDQLEFQITDRSSFKRFLDLGENAKSPDSKSIWLFGDILSKTGLLDKLFIEFEYFLQNQGYKAKGGAIVDATFVEVPKQRNNREENKQIKSGQVPDSFKENPHKLAQKDVDARWTKKGNDVFFGYKNHVEVDEKHKLIRAYEITSAEVHDSQVFEPLLEQVPQNIDVFADNAYRTPDNKVILWVKNLEDKMHYRGARNKPLHEELIRRNKLRSKVRVRVEHVFGHMQNSLKADLIRTIGIMRAKAQIALTNLTYNICRFVQLHKKSLATG